MVLKCTIVLLLEKYGRGKELLFFFFADLGEKNQRQHKNEDLPRAATARGVCDPPAVSCMTLCTDGSVSC